MSGYPLTILSPAATPAKRPMDVDAPLPVLPTMEGRAIGLLSNGKPNVDHLFRGIADQLRRAGHGRVLSFEKPSPNSAVPEPIFQELVSGCGLVITAMCD